MVRLSYARLFFGRGAGVILPFYDEESSLLYLAGKGDGNIRYYEVCTLVRTVHLAKQEWKENELLARARASTDAPATVVIRAIDRSWGRVAAADTRLVTKVLWYVHPQMCR